MNWECYICGGEVMWDADFDAEECGYDEKGIIHTFTCRDCGAEISVWERIEEDTYEDTEG